MIWPKSLLSHTDPSRAGKRSFQARASYGSPSAKRNRLNVVCSFSEGKGPPPTIKFMTVERKPLDGFAKVRAFPKEIQDTIWTLALQVPRIIEIEQNGGLSRIESDGMQYINRRIPAVLQVSCSSRQLALKVLTTIRHRTDDNFTYINNAVDAVLLLKYERGCSQTIPKFTWIGKISIAFRVGQGYDRKVFDEFDARMVKCKEVVIIPAKLPRHGWTTMIMSSDVEACPDPESKSYEVWTFIKDLRHDMTRVEKKSTAQVKTLSPRVRYASIESVMHTLCPYTYAGIDRVTDD